MQLILAKNQLRTNYIQIMRQVGYRHWLDPKTKEESFIRPVQGGFYPRYHIYIQETESELIFNLHLDQKQPRYEGVRAHNAEYDGPVLEQERARLQNLIR